jgi:hypothetical protein
LYTKYPSPAINPVYILLVSHRHTNNIASKSWAGRKEDDLRQLLRLHPENNGIRTSHWTAAGTV